MPCSARASAVSWRILLQNIVLHTDTALSNIMREERVSVLYIGDIQGRSSGPIMGQCLESGGRDHSNNFIFGLKPNSVIPRRLSEWIESTHFRYLGDWGLG